LLNLGKNMLDGDLKLWNCLRDNRLIKGNNQLISVSAISWLRILFNSLTTDINQPGFGNTYFGIAS